MYRTGIGKPRVIRTISRSSWGSSTSSSVTVVPRASFPRSTPTVAPVECRPGIEPDPLPVALDGAAARRVEALQEAEPERMLGPLHRFAPARLTEGEEGLEVRDAAAVVPDHEALRARART